jgi:hypothetical protein
MNPPITKRARFEANINLSLTRMANRVESKEVPIRIVGTVKSIFRTILDDSTFQCSFNAELVLGYKYCFTIFKDVLKTYVEDYCRIEYTDKKKNHIKFLSKSEGDLKRNFKCLNI